jgi:hypothetical protein
VHRHDRRTVDLVLAELDGADWALISPAATELGPDPVDGRFGHQAVLARVVEAGLLSNLFRINEVLAHDRQGGQAAALETGGVHHR